MIPYALMMLHMTWNTGETLQVRVLDPTIDGVSFRLSKRRRALMKNLPDEILVHFLDYGKRRYKTLPLKEYEICPYESMEDYYELRPIPGSDETYVFHELLKRLIKEYSDYIEGKLSMSELEFMEESCGYKFSMERSVSLEEWKKKHLALEALNELQLEQRDEELKEVELAISLDKDSKISKMLDMDWGTYAASYWRENALEGHFLTEQKVSHLYLGNQFWMEACQEFYTSLLEKALDYAAASELVPVLVLGTMSEDKIPLVEDLFLRLNQWKKNSGYQQAVEIVINDLGICLLEKSLVEQGRMEANAISFRLGTLFLKRVKDPRMVLRNEADRERMAYRSTSMDAHFYRTYLEERYGITKASYEVCGYPIEIGGTEDALHLPLYQTNTVAHNEWGEGYLFPDDFDLIGKWNSLFSISPYEMNDKNYLNVFIMCGISRLVVNL